MFWFMKLLKNSSRLIKMQKKRVVKKNLRKRSETKPKSPRFSRIKHTFISTHIFFHCCLFMHFLLTPQWLNDWQLAFERVIKDYINIQNNIAEFSLVNNFCCSLNLHRSMNFRRWWKTKNVIVFRCLQKKNLFLLNCLIFVACEYF